MLSWITIAGFVPISLYVSICFCSTCVTIQHLPLRLATGQRPSRRVHQRAWKRRYCEHCSSSHCDTFHACQRRSPPTLCLHLLSAGAEAGWDGLPRGSGEKCPEERGWRREHGSRKALLWLWVNHSLGANTWAAVHFTVPANAPAQPFHIGAVPWPMGLEWDSPRTTWEFVRFFKLFCCCVW